MMRVACGLDSMIVGEPQVLGQMKQAYALAQSHDTTGELFHQLFPSVFSAAKIIRTETDINAHPVSLAFAIVKLSAEIFERLENCAVLLVGAGETIELIATHLKDRVKKMVIANRTLEKSQVIANNAQAESICIHAIPDALNEIDIVITATASQLPILGKGLIESTLHNNIHKKLLLIDLAVPRDIEPEVAQLDRAHLYNIDDLQTRIANNIKNRSDAALCAEMMIDDEANQFYRKIRVFHARHVIAEYRNRLDEIRLCEQAKALQLLQQGHDPKTVLDQFGHALINKIMHHPTVKLRESASEDQCEMFQKIKTFFELG
jgi:glutamyl-tRNA reductase